MPKGPFGFPRLTNIGPLTTAEETTDVEQTEEQKIIRFVISLVQDTDKEEFIEFASDYADDTMLSDRQAQVALLKMAGFTHDEIGDFLDISTSTVDEHNRRVNQKFKKAKRTEDVLEEEYGDN